MVNVNDGNFQIGQIWITRNREKYRIVSIENENPLCWYPLLLEHVETKVLYTADAVGELFQSFQSLEDKLVIQISSDFDITDTEKDLASRMLKVYNKKAEQEKQERTDRNNKVIKKYKLIKKDDRRE